MLDPVSAALGASMALGLRGWMVHGEQVKARRDACRHDFEEVHVYGETKLLCRRCGFQRFKENP